MKISTIKIGKTYVLGRGRLRRVEDIKDGKVFWTSAKGLSGECKILTFANTALAEAVQG